MVLRERAPIAGGRVDCVECHTTRDAVIAMRGVRRVRSFRIVGEDDFRSQFTQAADDLFAELKAVLEFTVQMTEEVDAAGAEPAGRFELFFLA